LSHSIKLFVCVLAPSLAVAACSGQDEPEDATVDPFTNVSPQPPEPQMPPIFAPALNIDLAQMDEPAAGLFRRDLVIGEGAFATPGDLVQVHYTGWLPDGKQFDSSRSRGPFPFRLGDGNVIEGWELGVAGMREGGKRQLVIPPDLGYGAAGAGGGIIPGNATLVFEVELLSVD
jgi:hypothetical protein